MLVTLTMIDLILVFKTDHPAVPALHAVDYLEEVRSVNQHEETPESANWQIGL